MSPLVRRLTSDRHRRTWLLAAVLLVAAAAALPLLQADGLLNTRGGGDSPFLLQRLQQLVIALGDGHFPVRWMPDAAYGYGYPFFNYYAPLSIYVAALFRFLGFSYAGAIQLAQLAGFLLAAWAVFRLAQRWLQDEWAAALAAIAYTTAPFHLVNVYVRGDSLAEFWAMAFYPLVLLALERTLLPAEDHGPRRGKTILFLGLAYAALILSHNISALIFSPFLLLYAALAARRDGLFRLRSLREGAFRPRALRDALGGLALGLLLSAWFWLPALAETSLVQTAPVTAGYFHYGNHFLGADLVQPSLLFDYEVAGGRAFRMGLVQALLIGAGALVLAGGLWRLPAAWSEHRPGVLFILMALAIATAMMTLLSRVLWDNLPLLPFVQFPWRFLSIQALAGALAIGALAWLPGRRLLVPLAAGVLLLAAFADLEVDHLTLSDADVTSERLAQYEWFTGNVGSTVSAEYLPQSVSPRPYTSPWLSDGQRNRMQVLEGTASAVLLSRRSTRQSWAVEVSTGTATLEFPTLFWPGWQATVDGRPVEPVPAPGSGLITLQVPTGTHTVTLWLGRTPVRLAAEIMSLVGVLVGVWLLVIGDWGLEIRDWRLGIGSLRVSFRRLSKLPRKTSFARDWGLEIGDWRLWVVVLVLVLLIVVGRWLWGGGSYDGGTLTWDFVQLGYLHHAPQGVRFDDGLVLERYAYSSERVAPGETLRVTLYWSGQSSGGDGDVSVALVTPAVHRYEQAPPLTAVRRPVAAGAVNYELALPNNAPAGLYAPRLMLNGARALTPSGEPRGDLFLRPLRVTGEAVAGEDGSGLQVRVDRVQVPEALPPAVGGTVAPHNCASQAPSPASLLLQLAWRTAQPLSHNYTVSLRLTGTDGTLVAQCDAQPGYGFRPSGDWTAGQWVSDRLALPLPPRLPQSPRYALVAQVYDVSAGAVLTRRLGELVWEGEELVFRATDPAFTLPEGIEPLQARFGDVAALRGYEISRGEASLTYTLYWEALQPARDDYVRFAHLVHAGSGDIVAQVDGAPQHNTYPTSQWAAGEIVADSVTFGLQDVPDGTVRLGVGFYPSGAPQSRLPAFDAQGQVVADGRFFLPPVER